MSITQGIQTSLEQIKSKLPQVAKNIVTNNSQMIVEIIQSFQLSKGLNSDGVPLAWSLGTGVYGKSTQDYADKQGVSIPKTAGSPYNFQWTGDTFDSMGLKTKGKDAFEIFTIDGKQKLLEGIYGRIFDLTKENNEFVNETIILPNLYKYIIENA